MANESERRLKKAMDKLYHFPKPKSSPSSSQVEKSRRAEIGTRFGMERGSRLPTVRTFAGDPPPCRPWDRADLMRRLTTFKAMTWFAKPKVISAVNCARRGWINIEVDIISCEACGARLLFSTPSSWSLQQVEKAALVFSLKLDNGHKLLCPWIDNTCEESLVNFPPTLPEILTNNYRENLSSLSKLFYLPAIRSSAIEYMKSRAPQLEDILLKESFEGVFEGIRVSEELEGFEGLVQDSDLYFQALKLISLCGWEPHQLPYSVDRVNSNASDPLTESNLFSKPNETSSTLTIYSPYGESSNNSNNNNNKNNSFTLQCNFCKARVALWVFKTVERPLRLFKLVTNDDSIINNIDNNDDDNSNNNNNVGGLNANSIGGGPVPTRSKFRPRVSFPVVSRHLKCDLEGFGGLKRKRGDEDVLSECADVELIVEKQKAIDNGNDEFDPIKQHRTFCPWISPEDNPEILPGWKMTFLALLSQQKEKEKDIEAPPEDKRSNLLDEEEEDPVVSVRRLFTATPPKKLKLKNTP